jgi:hypothetical protein
LTSCAEIGDARSYQAQEGSAVTHARPVVFDWLALLARQRHTESLSPVPPDGGAFFEVAAALARRGGRFGEVRYSRPSSRPEVERQRRELCLEKLDHSFLGRGHVLVVPTRIPLSDLLFENNRMMWIGFNDLTAKIVEIVWLHLNILARCHVELVTDLASELLPGFENRACIEVFQNKGAFYKKCRRLDGGGRQNFRRRDARTAAFVLHLKEVPTLNGADLLIFFGMGGIETLALAHHLRTDLAHLLDESCFAMIEFSEATRPLTLPDSSYATTWRPRVILHTEPRLPASSDPEAAMARVLFGPSGAPAA